jgi:amino acid transporter
MFILERLGNLSGQKTIAAAAVVLAVVLAFLMVGVSYVLFPDIPSEEPPIPMPTSKPETLTEQIFSALPWIGLAACTASIAVGTMLLISKIRTRRTPQQ